VQALTNGSTNTAHTTRHVSNFLTHILSSVMNFEAMRNNLKDSHRAGYFRHTRQGHSASKISAR
jgi:hypothetical protein